MSHFKAVSISETLSVAGQVALTDLPAIAAAGFRSIVCNRPDGESAGQLASKELEIGARQAGLKVAYLPVISGRVTWQEGQEFGRLLEDLPSPVLAYCRSGLRSVTLWALSQARSQAWPELVKRAAQAGFDLRNVVPPTDGLR